MKLKNLTLYFYFKLDEQDLNQLLKPYNFIFYKINIKKLI